MIDSVERGQWRDVTTGITAQTSLRSLEAAAAARFEKAARDHLAVLWRTLKRLGVPDAGVDDAVQQILMVAHRKFATIEPGRERPYLLGIAVKVAADARRALRRRREVPIEDAAVEAPRAGADGLPDEALDHKRALVQLSAVLSALPDEVREAFVLFEIEELCARDVAEALGVPTGTVASRVRRARELIRKNMSGRGGEP